MTVRKPFILLTAAAATLSLAPAALAADDSTTVSVTLQAGSLTIAAPDAASLGTISVAPGSVATAAMGETTVTDARGTLLGWSVTALTTTASMSTAGATPKTIPLTAAAPLGLVTGTVTAGTGSLLSGVSAGAGGFLNNTTPVPVAVSLLGAGGGTYTYNPTLTFTVPPNTEAGTYSVVVTQTVS
ncbi:MAG TPA: hypothetical protein VM938_13025 [Acidimicrobiales bacterium]|nr:hypothetical protein [Acidimicrobiales bacterium]